MLLMRHFLTYAVVNCLQYCRFHYASRSNELRQTILSLHISTVFGLQAILRYTLQR